MERMEQEAQRVIEQTALSGNKVEKATVLGFEGLKSTGVFYGRSKLGLMVRLSGHVAATEWDSFYPLLSNVTRIDCAVTIKLDMDQSGLSYKHWVEALEYQKKTAPKFKVVHIDGGKHGSTLLLGSRQSETYGRIYDKYLESKQECYRNCWRYEVEFKGRAATECAYQLYREPSDLGVPVAIVSEWFRKRRVYPAFSATAFTRYRVHRQPTSVERRLTWLYTQVGPAVRELCEMGYARQVEKALFGGPSIQPTRLDDAVKRASNQRAADMEEKWEQEYK